MKLVKDGLSPEEFIEKYNLKDELILNVGSSSVRYGSNCFNLDIIDKGDVDIVADMHDIPEQPEKFEAAILCASLQYSHDPYVVMGQLYDQLKPGGLLFMDAPWIQPYCPDTPDRLRFSEDQLIKMALLSGFYILESGPSIRSGSALWMLATSIAEQWSRNKYVNHALSKVVGAMLYPVKWIKTQNERHVAGAFYVVCKKPLL